MYKLSAPIIHENNPNLPIIKKFLKEVFGYTEDEIQHFVDNSFMCDVAKHLTLEQACLILQPFEDYDIRNFPYLQDEQTNKYLSYIEAGIHITKQPPKDHYYDEPVISRDHLVNPFTQKEIERQENLAKRRAEEVVQRNTSPTITNSQYTPKCPTCNSPDVEKISLTSKVVGGALFGLFSSNVRKTMHCKNCGYKW